MTDNNESEQERATAKAELDAALDIYDILQPLSQDGRKNAVNWVVGKLDIAATLRKKARSSNGEDEASDSDDEENGSDRAEFSEFADLCSAVSPKTDAQKALVAGYWFQVCLGQDNFKSQDCNGKLKHYGAPIGNITRAFDTLKSSRFVAQLHKSGTSKQGRKKFKLTTLGIEEVKRMLDG